MRLNQLIISYTFILAGIISSASHALTFTITDYSNMVGKIQTTVVQYHESLSDIGKKFDIGVYEMIEANPNLDPWSPRPGETVIIPSQFVLPATKREGIVINLAEMRLYYYHPTTKLVTTHPIGIGRKGWITPLLETRVTNKQYNPTWRPPVSIIKEYADNGEALPNLVPPGPENPLGEFAIYLATSGYLIHGTNRPGGIGLRTTSGCIRLYPEDIRSLYEQVAIGTNVKIIHEPYKIGFQHNQLYLESHEPLSEKYYNKEPINVVLKKTIQHYIEILNAEDNNELYNLLHLPYLIEILQKSAKTTNGYPQLIQLEQFAKNKITKSET